eukprot:7508578-Ditylum_brightwellii.AAC.1
MEVLSPREQRNNTTRKTNPLTNGEVAKEGQVVQEECIFFSGYEDDVGCSRISEIWSIPQRKAGKQVFRLQ